MKNGIGSTMRQRPLTKNSDIASGDRDSWPPHCCVPAFINAALIRLGYPPDDPYILPGLLGVCVGPKDLNPLKLRVTDDNNERGLSATDAVARINRLFKTQHSNIVFQHVPLKTIAYNLYEEFMEAALENDIVVGIGVDYPILSNNHGPTCRHVLRVERLYSGLVHLFDDSLELDPPHIETDFEQIERASLNVADGFWLIGMAQNFDLPYLTPCR